MKTARRHELQTNELSQQLDELSAYVQKNGWRILTVVVAIIIVFVAGYLYIAHQREMLAQGWADLARYQGPPGATPADQIRYFKEIEQRGLDPRLSANALYQAAQLALAQVGDPNRSDSEQADYARQAEEMFQQITQRFRDQPPTVAAAQLGLGLLAENRGDWEAARRLYRAVVDDPRFAAMPARMQAEYRLKQMSNWEAAVVFPPPATAPAVSAADGSVAPAADAAAPANLTPSAIEPAAPLDAGPDGSAPMATDTPTTSPS